MAGLVETFTGFLRTRAHNTIAVAVACWIVIYADGKVWSEIRLDATVRQGLIILGILAACLAGTALVRALYERVPIDQRFGRWLSRRRAQRELREYIPFMTPEERNIIGYLLHHNQKTFTAAADGGYAATLLARNIVVVLAQPGQRVHPEDVPMVIPEYLWTVFVEEKAAFPYMPPATGREVHPWRVHWMAR